MAERLLKPPGVPLHGRRAWAGAWPAVRATRRRRSRNHAGAPSDPQTVTGGGRQWHRPQKTAIGEGGGGGGMGGRGGGAAVAPRTRGGACPLAFADDAASERSLRTSGGTGRRRSEWGTQQRYADGRVAAAAATGGGEAIRATAAAADCASSSSGRGRAAAAAPAAAAGAGTPPRRDCLLPPRPSCPSASATGGWCARWV